MADAEIHYKLDLIVRLVDTTTGASIRQRQVAFTVEDRVIPFLRRDEGLYVLLNRGRNDVDLTIQVTGFLPAVVKIRYAELSESFPEVEAAMIPEISTSGFIDMLTLEGHCPGMESIAAVSLKKAYGAVDSYQERDRPCDCTTPNHWRRCPTRSSTNSSRNLKNFKSRRGWTS